MNTKIQGGTPFRRAKKTPEFGGDTLKLLVAVHKGYGGLSAKELESLTHKERPWQEARGSLPLEAKCDTPIKKTTMKECYQERITNGRK